MTLALLVGRRLLSDTPRHLVLVVLDTVRADHLSLYGYARDTTPFLRELAESSLVFERAKAPAPWTIPSHASFFTALWPAEHRAQWGRITLADRHLTLAEVLGAHGFRTVGFSSNPFVSERHGLAQGFAEFRLIEGEPAEQTGKILGLLPALLDRVQREDVRLFLFLNLMDAHIPYNAGRYAWMFGVSDPLAVGDHGLKWEINAGVRRYDRELREQQIAAYDAALRRLDDALRTIVEELTRRGMLEETLLVLTADHGEGLGEHPEIGHSISTWEEQLAVPLLIRLPSGRLAGSRVAELTSLVALPVSVVDWLGLVRPSPWKDRPDLLEVASRHVSADYRSYFSERTRRMNTGMARRYPELARRILHTHVLYCGDLKLSVDAAGHERLYDLARDPHESRELSEPSPADAEPCRARYRSLLAGGRYTAFHESETEAERARDREAFDEESLRSLGYLP